MKKTLFIFLSFLSMACIAQNTLQYADSIRNSSSIPELSYAVVTKKSILEIAALGRHSIALKDSASLNDRFHIGSNTKAMTAFMIAKYVEKGKLQWTTKFFDLFPEWKKVSKPDYYEITLEDLLSHRAGIQPFQGENDPIIPEFKGTKQEKRNQFGKFVLTLEPAKIDTVNTFTYSNAGYTLATLILEKVTKKSWEQLVEKVFNHDLKLNVKLSWPENQKARDTWGHSFENGKLNPIPSNIDFHLDYTEPAGDLNIRLTDYIKFVQLNLDGLEGHDNYLKSDTYQYIHAGIENYSLGWFNIQENGKEWSTHFGTVGTYYTNVQIDRTGKVAYIIFANSFTDETVNGVRSIMRKLKENYGRNG